MLFIVNNMTGNEVRSQFSIFDYAYVQSFIMQNFELALPLEVVKIANMCFGQFCGHHRTKSVFQKYERLKYVQRLR